MTVLDKHALYIMSKSCSSFTCKPWITAAITNSIKSNNKIYKIVCKEKKRQQREIYGKQFKTYEYYMNITKFIFRKIKKT